MNLHIFRDSSKDKCMGNNMITIVDIIFLEGNTTEILYLKKSLKPH